MRLIGNSIQEAIDWTQDFLRTTRPLAERTLFSMLSDKKVKETEQGFVLVEAEEGEDEAKKRHHAIRHASHGKPPRRLRFHNSRKLGHKHLKHYHKQQFKRLDHLDHSDEADEMIESEDQK